MTNGITWTDIRGSIPQPLRADKSAFDNRIAEVILWRTPDNSQPYTVEVRLLVDGSVIERWTHTYSGAAGLSRATVGYDEIRDRAGQWLSGVPLERARPARGWRIEKG